MDSERALQVETILDRSGRPYSRVVTVLLVFAVASLGIARTEVAAQVPFVEQADARGIDVVSFLSLFGHGMALNDFDADGDLDLMVTGTSFLGLVQLFENDGAGYFTEVANSGLPMSTGITGLAVADFDSDGLLDVCMTAENEPDLLYHNNGQLSFSSVSSLLGDPANAFSQGAVWADYDGDGWLDLYISVYNAGEPKLFHNEQGTGFSERRLEVGLAVDEYTFQPLFYDYDRDGDQDLYLIRDEGTHANVFYRNDGGQFIDRSVQVGADLYIDGMGGSLCDVNRDLRYDVFMSDNVPTGTKLLVSQADGTYVELATESGLELPGRGWGTLVLDADNDGLSEIFVTTENGPNYFYRGLPGGLFEEAAVLSGVAVTPGFDPLTSQSYTVVAGDIDADGDIDMFVQTKNQPLALFINSGNGNSWLEVSLIQSGPNRNAVGASIELRQPNHTLLQPIIAGTGLRSSNPLRAHFGMLSAPTAQSLVVYWPDGAVSELQDVAANQHLVIDRDVVGSYLDCNGNSIADVDDVGSGSSFDINADGIPDECQPLFRRGDANDDALADLSDAIFMLDFLFLAGEVNCMESADTNDSGAVDIADVLYLLIFLFDGSGGSIPSPAGACGLDETLDAQGDLGCAQYLGC